VPDIAFIAIIVVRRVLTAAFAATSCVWLMVESSMAMVHGFHAHLAAQATQIEVPNETLHMRVGA